MEVGTTPWPNTPDPLPNPVLPHLTAEERARAQEAWKLGALLGHPGQQTLMRDLQNNCFASTALTSVDVANAVKIFGPCPACIGAKSDHLENHRQQARQRNTSVNAFMSTFFP